MINRNLANIIFTIATILVVVFTISFGIYENRREHAFRCDILHAQLQLNNFTRNDSSIRLTIIDTLGNVLYDSYEKNLSVMGNHLKRKEVQEALAHGSGYDIKRTSNTNGEKYFYSATYFPQRGEIVRSAVPYSAPLTASLEQDYTFFYYTAGILALIAIVLYFRLQLTHSENEKQRIKRQLTENAAHELKTPAATISGYLETLVDNPTMPQEKRDEFIERCYAQSKRMSQLLQDMSMLTLLDTKSISTDNNKTSIDLATVIKTIIDETREQFKERGISVFVNIPQKLTIQANHSLIYSLVHNIVINALTHATGASCFTVNLIPGKSQHTLSFIDNGVGVPQEHLDHIFERFYRVDKGRSRKFGGTGLGLSIVKNTAMHYGGNATATTTPGGGLTITIKLAATNG